MESSLVCLKRTNMAGGENLGWDGWVRDLELMCLEKSSGHGQTVGSFCWVSRISFVGVCARRWHDLICLSSWLLGMLGIDCRWQQWNWFLEESGWHERRGDGHQFSLSALGIALHSYCLIAERCSGRCVSHGSMSLASDSASASVHQRTSTISLISLKFFTFYVEVSVPRS